MLALRCAQVFDGERFSAGPATVLLDAGRVVGVESGHPEMAEPWQVIDYRTATAVPGLIDTHVHLTCDSRPGALDRVPQASADELHDIVTQSLSRQLAAGVTTVRDLGDIDFHVLAYRAQPAPGLRRIEPTIVASGPPLTVAGGHCHFLGGVIGNTEGDVALAIRKRVELGADVVKVMASGGMLTPGTDVMRTQFSGGQLRLIVESAHAAGLPVTAHAHGLPAVEEAVDAGVDGVEHCSCLTDTGMVVPDRLIAAMADHGVAVSGVIPPKPGMDLTEALPAIRDFFALTGLSMDRIRELRAQMIARLHEAGVTVVTGLDAGLNPWLAHGNLPAALDLLSEAGLTSGQILAAATARAAEVCGLGDRKGKLRADYDADVVLLDGDASGDVPAACRRIVDVYVGGQLVEEPSG
ncbi:MAG TPA: amidohydrolase family protein [Propionibacteriaceae bacterium]|nr:amidohydrolase family protein [Propionibacteriaceae bacterium]